MDPIDIKEAIKLRWPDGSGTQNAVKRVAAELLLSHRDRTLHIGTLGSTVSYKMGQPLKQLLNSSFQKLLQADAAFKVLEVTKVKQKRGSPKNSTQTVVQLQPTMIKPSASPAAAGKRAASAVTAVPAAAGAAAAPSPRKKQKKTATPRRQGHAAAQAAAADAHAVQAPVAATPAAAPLLVPATFGLHMQQQADGSITALLSHQHSSGAAAGSSSPWVWEAAPAGAEGPSAMVAVGAGAGQAGRSSSDDGGQEELSCMLRLMGGCNRMRAALAPYTAPGAWPFLVDVAADVGRDVTLRLSDGSSVELPCSIKMDQALATLAQATGVPAGSLFGGSNRLGVPGSLNRVTCMRNRQGHVVGLSYRLARHLPGVATLLADMLSTMHDAARAAPLHGRAPDTTGAAGPSSSRGFALAGGTGLTQWAPGRSSLLPAGLQHRCRSLLLLGRSGVGSTTLLRDVARLMSSPASQGGLGMTVLVVDTYGELGGEAEPPHPLGHARRMMVPTRTHQAQVMLEAVRNHKPQVVIIDEVATQEEADACRAITARGVLVVAGAHDVNLGGLLGGGQAGVQAQVAGGGGGSSSGLPFDMMVELLDTHRLRLHPDAARSLGVLLGHCRANGLSLADLNPGPHTPTGYHTQLRSRAGPGPLLGAGHAAPNGSSNSSEEGEMSVTFECGLVPATAAWVDGAGLVAAAAAAAAGGGAQGGGAASAGLAGRKRGWGAL